jgi:PIN domain nuclease of toxin-antitoxin system
MTPLLSSPQVSASNSVLLDSNVVIWLSNKSSRLSAQTIYQLQTYPDVYVSAISALEISIKQAIGKLSLAGSVSEMIRIKNLKELPVTVEHGEAVRSLPLFHRDPFDRLLLAQAQVEGLVLVTADRMFARYGVPVLMV